MDRQDLIEEYITDRINQIIGGMDPDKIHEYYEKQEVILQSLNQESKDTVETLIDVLVEWGADECKEVFKAAFLEGLWLGHIAF